MERWYEVGETGVMPALLSEEEIADMKKDNSWMMFHSYKGRLLFENYSRAMLCFFERNGN